MVSKGFCSGHPLRYLAALQPACVDSTSLYVAVASVVNVVGMVVCEGGCCERH